MITTKSQQPGYRTEFTNGKEIACADTTASKDGSQSGFRPHELLEAALANCLNISARMQAERRGLQLSSVATKVELDRSRPGEAVFRYSVDLAGDLSAEDRKDILDALSASPVLSTLSREVSFESQD